MHRPRMLDTSRCTLSCGSLHSSVRYRPRPWRVSPGRVRPFTAFPLVQLNSNTVTVQWLVPYGLGWLGIHSLDVVLLKNLIDNSGAMRMCLIVPEDGVRMSLNRWIIGVPFRTQVCPPPVWLSLWMTWPRPIFDTISLFVTNVYKNLILLL